MRVRVRARVRVRVRVFLLVEETHQQALDFAAGYCEYLVYTYTYKYTHKYTCLYFVCMFVSVCVGEFMAQAGLDSRPDGSNVNVTPHSSLCATARSVPTISRLS